MITINRYILKLMGTIKNYVIALIYFVFILLSLNLLSPLDVNALDMCLDYNTQCDMIPNPENCKFHCGRTYPPYGAAPVTDANTVSNCPVRATHTGYGVTGGSTADDDLMVPVTSPWGPTLIYCPQNTSFYTLATGQIVVYSMAYFTQVTAASGTFPLPEPPVNTTGYLTGLNINDNQLLTVRVGLQNDNGAEKYDAKGWRAYTGAIGNAGIDTFFTNATANATANGYTIISKQLWGDAGSDDSVYDTYDLNDTGILVAIKAPLNPPTCGENVLTLSARASDGKKIYLGESAQFSMTGTTPSLYYTTSFSNSFKPTSTTNLGFAALCNPSLPTPANCTITNKINNLNPTSVIWTHTYRNCKDFICSAFCTAQVTFPVYPYPGSSNVTGGGDLYIKNSINQSRLSSYPFALAQFSLSSSTAKINAIPSADVDLSENLKLLFEYTDSNSDTDVYTKLKNQILKHEELKEYTIELSADYGIADQFVWDSFTDVTSDEAPIKVIFFLSNVVMGPSITCDSKTILFIPGNFTMTPPFSVEGDNGCIFVVGGTTTILSNTTLANNISAFIITNNLQTHESNYPLTIKGGVITTTTTLARNINRYVTLTGLINKTNPSETIIFEGARYYKHFKGYLSNPIVVNIKQPGLN